MEMLKLLYLMQSDIYVTEYFKANNYYSRIYEIISETLHSNCFSQMELMFLMNILVNIATDAAFHFTIERYLFYDFKVNKSDEKILNFVLSEIEERYKGVIKYLLIKNPHYLEMVFLLMYELKFDEKLKSIYFFLFNEMVLNSNYNAQLLSKETFLEKLTVMLRIEINYTVKLLITTFLANILRDHMDIAKLKCFIMTMRYNYYWNDVIAIFPKLKEEQYKANFFDFDNFHVSLKLFFSVQQKIVTTYIINTSSILK